MTSTVRRIAVSVAPPAQPAAVTPLPLPRLVPLIRVQMAKRGVPSVRALYELLAPYDRREKDGSKGGRHGPGKEGLRLSKAQLYKLVDGSAKQINVEGLLAVAAVLGCGLDDLYAIEPPPVASTPTKGAP